MNKREEKEKLQKYTIGYLIAMVVIFVIVLVGVNNPGLKTIALIATVIIFVALIILQWKKTSVAVTEETPPRATENLASAPEAKDPPKPHQNPVPNPPRKEAAPNKKEKEPASDIRTRTGSVCTEPGEYHCSMHPHRTVVMDEGKRFPPCRGDKKGHSAIWVLDVE